MELEFGVWFFPTFLGGLVAVCLILKRANEWYHVSMLGRKQYYSLPPGDMGWPLIGNMLSFLITFKFGYPDSFISNFVTRFGRTGIYKAYLFGSPTIIVTAPETCRPALMDDTQFKPGWPKSTFELMGRKSFLGLSAEEHKRLRRLTAAPISGKKALSTYHEFMKDVIVSSLDELAEAERPVEFFTEVRKITFKIIVHIFLGGESGPIIDSMKEEYTKLNCGLRAMAINLPGFAYHKALKARKKLVKILQDVIDRRRVKKEKILLQEKKDMMDLLLDVEDDDGRKLDDEEIADVILMYLNAGHESTAHATLWAILFLYEHPEYLQKAKAEQEEILRRRSPTEEGLSFKEIKQMEYLSKVIDETLRVVNVSLFTCREAKTDVNICGYTIPEGWKVLIWFRGVHLDSEHYQNPKEFNPSRWNEIKPRKGAFIPFGAGSRLCPGSDLTKLELSTFLHYFLLYYELERLNPGCAVGYLPHTRPKDNCLAKVKKSLSA
ncbi:ent-kaurenoic acid oxidase 2 isoform X1 [Morus notabilis]|uniref:ent-kaurenoic acid oxidase 2 isoform X1 n=1 Tax=Morus notabilis TaxID=981085 RepID=UPI000CED0531|nr:ent-kaurenoic acid oxidase 2 isoform X1 [Morus notabilis]